MRKIYIDNSTFMEQKEIMKQVWNDIFNNEHCTCRDFEDYWNWKISEKEMKISKEEFDFRVKCVEKCLEDIKNNDEPMRSLFDICIATDLDDKECLDWYEGFNNFKK